MCMYEKDSDNRWEIIRKAQDDIISKTNIESSADEMAVLGNFLFRCWQMGWLKKYETTKYRKKPVIVEAVKIPFIFSTNVEDYPKWFVDAIENETIVTYRDMMTGKTDYVEIKTLEGVMTANVGDYIIQGVNGEIYSCKSDIFEKTYEKVEE